MKAEWKAFLDRLDSSELGQKSPITNICRQFEQSFEEKDDVHPCNFHQGENHD